MNEIQSNLKYEHVSDVHEIWKLLKSQKVSYDDFTVAQIYQLKDSYGHLFDEEFNALPKKFDEDGRVLSQSSIKTYRKCPRYWYYNYVKHAPREIVDETWLKFGSVIHLVLSKFYEEIDIEAAKADPKSHFIYILKMLANQHWDYSLDRKLFDKDAMDIFENFAEVFGNRFMELNESGNLSTFFPVSTEEEIWATTHPLKCIVDRINPGMYAFADYKTNKWFPDILLRDPRQLNQMEVNEYNNVVEDYAIQAVINAICIHDKYKVMPKVCLFIFVRHLKQQHGGIVPITINQALVDQVIGYVNDLYAQMQSNVYPKTKDVSSCTAYGGCDYSALCDAQDQCVLNF